MCSSTSSAVRFALYSRRSADGTRFEGIESRWGPPATLGDRHEPNRRGTVEIIGAGKCHEIVVIEMMIRERDEASGKK